MAILNGQITASDVSQTVLPANRDRGGVIVGVRTGQVGTAWFSFGDPAVKNEGFFVEPGAQQTIDANKAKGVRLALNVINGNGDTPTVNFAEF